MSRLGKKLIAALLQSDADARSASFYDKLATRLYVSPDLVKTTLYSLGYGGVVDPWLKHLVLAESHTLVEEALRGGRPRIDVTPKTLDDLPREGKTKGAWFTRRACQGSAEQCATQKTCGCPAPRPKRRRAFRDGIK